MIRATKLRDKRSSIAIGPHRFTEDERGDCAKCGEGPFHPRHLDARKYEFGKPGNGKVRK